MIDPKFLKYLLELGSSDSFIVCQDADMDNHQSGAVKEHFINCGQSCIASMRCSVAKNVAGEFIEKFVQKIEKLKVGDALSEDVDIGSSCKY